MKGFVPLLKKELKEQWRTYRLLIAASVFLFFGITTPLMLKYLPEILKMAAEQYAIAMPPPTAAQSLMEFSGTIGQIGILVAVLLAMGAIATERQRGTAVITLSKPVSYAAFVQAKFMAISLTFIISLMAASVICFAYTVWLIESTGVMPFAGMMLLLGMFLLFAIAVTLLFSSFFKSSVAAGGISIGVIIAFSALSSVPVVGDYLPGKLLAWGNNLLTASGHPYWWALGVTVMLTVACLILAPRILKNKEI